VTRGVSPTPRDLVHIVEDDKSVRVATARFLQAAGHTVKTYGNAAEFLAEPRTRGCVVLDLQLPGASGLDVQQALAAAGDPMPVIFLSGHGQISDSVRAMKAGAVDFLTKTADGATLLEAVEQALARGEEQRADAMRRRQLRDRYELLSPRERDVFAHLISGQLNKQVGFDLGISLQTTKIHRHRVLQKMQAESIVHLARMADDLGIAPVGRVR
jgi:FixJ family two-component response regulator